MFRIASIVLLAASLSSGATAQAADLAVEKGATEPQPSANGSVGPENGSAPADAPVNADAVAAHDQQKPIDKPLPFPIVDLQLSVSDSGLLAMVHGPEAGFVGVLGLSLGWELTPPSADLPPILAGGVVVAYGFTTTQDLKLTASLQNMPAEAMFLYAQALVIGSQGLCASGIVPLVVGGTSGEVGRILEKAAAN